MKTTIKLSSIFIAIALCHSPSFAQEKNQDKSTERTFIGLTFHDVRDDVLKQGDKDVYAVSTRNLVQFFEWLKDSPWHPISLKEIAEAKKNGTPLPENAVVISFDDGALSGYTHVYPLIQQYKVPVVFAIVTSWTNGNTQAAYEAYGKGNLMTWAQMREMKKSGLVEFASHSDDMHKGVLANPQGNQQPAALTHQYFPTMKRYETDAEYQQRLYYDLKKSKDILNKELGIDSLAIIWPYGAVNPETTRIAAQAGFPLSFSLGVDRPNKKSDAIYQRGLVMNNPTAEDLHQQMTEFVNNQQLANYNPIRAVTVDLKQFKSENVEQGNQILGLALNQISALTTNTLILKVLADPNKNGVYDQAYFPTSHLQLDQDVLNRVTWQARTRVFNRVTAQLPIYPDPSKPLLVVDLAEDLVKNNKGIDGIMLNAENRLACIFNNNRELDTACQSDLNAVLNLSDAIQKRTYQYLNSSNSQNFYIQLNYVNSESQPLSTVVDAFKNDFSLINFEIDSLDDPKLLKSFIEHLNHFSALEKTKLMVTINNDDIKHQKDWQLLSEQLKGLQRAGIQKLAISNYGFENAQHVHQYLYTPLSLNSSALLYRDPFQIDSQQGVKK